MNSFYFDLFEIYICNFKTMMQVLDSNSRLICQCLAIGLRCFRGQLRFVEFVGSTNKEAVCSFERPGTEHLRDGWCGSGSIISITINQMCSLLHYCLEILSAKYKVSNDMKYIIFNLQQLYSHQLVNSVQFLQNQITFLQQWELGKDYNWVQMDITKGSYFLIL